MAWYRLIYITIGVGALFLGSLYYAVFRPEPPWLINWFVDDQENRGISHIQYFGNNIPTFTHVFGFSLISAAFVDRKLSSRVICAPVWFLINLFFELISLLPVAITACFIPFSVARIITRGTFDIYDIVAALIGAICAISIIHVYPRSKRK